MVANILLVGALGSCLLAPVPPVPYEERYNPFEALATDPVPEGRAIPFAERAAAWEEATGRLPDGGVAHPPKSWAPPEAIRVNRSYRMAESQLLGIYMKSHLFGRKGKMLIAERIVIFLPPEAGCHQHEVLVHEYLHALHQRLNHVTPVFQFTDPEAFVAHFLPDEPEVLEPCPSTP